MHYILLAVAHPFSSILLVLTLSQQAHWHLRLLFRRFLVADNRSKQRHLLQALRSLRSSFSPANAQYAIQIPTHCANRLGHSPYVFASINSKPYTKPALISIHTANLSLPWSHQHHRPLYVCGSRREDGMETSIRTRFIRCKLALITDKKLELRIHAGAEREQKAP